MKRLNVLAGEKLSRKELLKFSKEELISMLLQKNSMHTNSSKKEKRKKTFHFEKYGIRKIALLFSYIGIDYDGLVRQENTENTVEANLIKTLQLVKCIKDVTSAKIEFCGRTDKGVSATGQVVSLFVRCVTSKGRGILRQPESAESCELNYPSILNRVLPANIRILAYTFVDIGFSARNFCRCKKNEIKKFERTVIKAEIKQLHEPVGSVFDQCGMAILEIKASGFLWHQIRCIMSLLLYVGRNKLSIDCIEKFLDFEKNGIYESYPFVTGKSLILSNAEYLDLKWMFNDSILNTLKSKHIFSDFINLFIRQKLYLLFFEMYNNVYDKDQSHIHTNSIAVSACIRKKEVCLKVCLFLIISILPFTFEYKKTSYNREKTVASFKKFLIRSKFLSSLTTITCEHIDKNAIQLFSRNCNQIVLLFFDEVASQKIIPIHFENCYTQNIIRIIETLTCNTKSLDIRCSNNEIIEIVAAQWGRFEESKCMKQFLDQKCTNDVTQFVDDKCSFKESCNFSVSTVNHDRIFPNCNSDLSLHMKTQHKCVKFFKFSELIDLIVKSNNEPNNVYYTNLPNKDVNFEVPKLKMLTMDVYTKSFHKIGKFSVKDIYGNEKLDMVNTTPTEENWNNVVDTNHTAHKIEYTANNKTDDIIMLRIKTSGCGSLNIKDIHVVFGTRKYASVRCDSQNKTFTVRCEDDVWDYSNIDCPKTNLRSAADTSLTPITQHFTKKLSFIISVSIGSFVVCCAIITSVLCVLRRTGSKESVSSISTEIVN
ncbi:tRNA pseudouridine synthase 3 [Intoshia linei]|uniref:tRNA pseudouridine synthase 3 n=1 Tax=Intoshia linei TaxID=1819745 RepID=A0A177B8F5_9BILA|nr:tRNA pseudouridine synthase 3 [Intoshia linei]